MRRDQVGSISAASWRRRRLPRSVSAQPSPVRGSRVAGAVHGGVGASTAKRLAGARAPGRCSAPPPPPRCVEKRAQRARRPHSSRHELGSDSCRPPPSTTARAPGDQPAFARGARRSIVARVEQQLGGAALVHHVEVRRDARLEREAAQQRLAEGVDGLDLHAARHIEHAREQPARAACVVAAVALADQRAQLRAQLRVVRGRPSRPAFAHACGIAISAAAALVKVRQRMRGRRRAVQQQAEHAVGQHRRLAGAGGGRDPERTCRRIGRAALRLRVGRSAGRRACSLPLSFALAVATIP